MSETALPDSLEALARPALTDHAAQQWHRRMPADSVAPEVALADAVSVHDGARSLFQTGDNPVPDDVHLYRGCADGEVFGAVFIVMDGAREPDAVTTYRIRSRHDAGIRAYCWARLAQEGGR